MAFLVEPDLALTCHHVVRSAAADGECRVGTQITVDLPLVTASSSENGVLSVTAEVVLSLPPVDNGGGDIAVLRLQESFPGGRPVRIVKADDVWEHQITTFGFPDELNSGVWHRGYLLAPQADRWIQAHLADPNGYPIKRGFSGAPAWDDVVGGVVGMIVAVDSSTTPAGYLIPTEALLRAWPDLEALIRPASPYRGLARFQESDREVFFGRSAEISELVSRLQGRLPVTVAGPSGCGKSSLVFAGVLPALRERNGNRSVVVSFRPSDGETVYKSLANALLPALEPDRHPIEAERFQEMSKLADVLAQGGFADVVARVLIRAEADELLVVLDQGEELLAQNPEQANQFAEQMLGAAAPPRLRMLLTLREDFLDTARRIPALNGRHMSVFELGPMTTEQLRAVVAGPVAGTPGVEFEAGLVQRIVADVGTDPGGLPLLGFTMSRLWDEQSRGQLTHNAYDALGRVPGSLGQHAEDVCSSEVRADEEAVRKLFFQLIRVYEGDNETWRVETRRVATRDDLGGPRWELAERLATNRLLVIGRDAEGRDTVELAHEALIRGWPRLDKWIKENWKFLVWREGLRADRDRWERAGRDSDLLIPRRALTTARAWCHEHFDDLTEEEWDFIRRAEARQRRRRQLLVVSVIVAALLLWSAILILDQKQDQRASRAFAVQSLEVSERDPVYASMLALVAYQIDSTEQARKALRQQYVNNRGFAAVFSGAPDPLNDVQVSRDDQVLAATTDSGVVMVWSRLSGEMRTIRTPPGLEIYDTVLMPDGSAVWLAERGWLTRLDIASGVRRTMIPLDLPVGDVGEMAVSPDGAKLAMMVGGKVLEWDTRTGKRIGELPIPSADGIIRFAFGPDARSLILLIENLTAPDIQYRLELLDLATGSSRMIATSVYDATVSPDGEVAAICQESDSGSRATAVRLTDGAELDYADLRGGSCSYFAADRTGLIVAMADDWSIDEVDTDKVALLDLRSGAKIAQFTLPPSEWGWMTLPLLTGSRPDYRFAMYEDSRVVLIDVHGTSTEGSGEVLPDDPQAWQGHLCRIIGRKGFTDEERSGLHAQVPKGHLCP